MTKLKKIDPDAFEILKNEIGKGEIIVGVDKARAYDWWRTTEELRSTNFSATLLLVKNWGFFALALFLFLRGQVTLGVISILIGIAIVSFGKRQYTQKFRKHVINNPKSFMRFYTLGAATLKSAKTGKTASFPEDWITLLEGY